MDEMAGKSFTEIMYELGTAINNSDILNNLIDNRDHRMLANMKEELITQGKLEENCE